MVSRIRKWWNRNFAKRPPINENWRPGDKAACVAGGEWEPNPYGPRQGEVAIVQSVMPLLLFHGDMPGWGLQFAGYSGYWDATCFRKIVPSSAEFAERIRRCRPIRAKEPVS